MSNSKHLPHAKSQFQDTKATKTMWSALFHVDQQNFIGVMTEIGICSEFLLNLFFCVVVFIALHFSFHETSNNCVVLEHLCSLISFRW